MRQLLLLIFTGFTGAFIHAQCIISYLDASIGPCDATSSFDVNFNIEFAGAPATGTLVLGVNNGVTDYTTVISAPFTSPLSDAVTGIPSTGLPSQAYAYFSDNVQCESSVSFTAPDDCNCLADAGTFTAQITGNSQIANVLVWGDDMTISSNLDHTFPAEVTNPSGPPYDPGFFYLVYTCPPDLNLFPASDTCFYGVVDSGMSMTMTNDSTGVYFTIPGSLITGNTLYYVPVTMYSMSTSTISYVNTSVPCYDYGEVFPVVHVGPIIGNPSSNPGNGTCNIQVTGGYPALNGSNYTIGNLSPATASLDLTSVPHGGSFTISGLSDGQVYAVDITDDAGSILTISNMYLDIEEEELQSLQVFPNPFKDQVTISGASADIGLRVIDPAGQEVYSTSVTGEQILDLSALDSGMYILLLSSGESVKRTIIHKL